MSKEELRTCKCKEVGARTVRIINGKSICPRCGGIIGRVKNGRIHN